MSKIICDVCGTSYADTSNQCPICGCIRPVDVQPSSYDTEVTEGAAGYTHVKGGRFSKSNVKKRNKTRPATYQEELQIPRQSQPQAASGGGGRNNTALVVLTVVLLLIVIAVVVFITIKFFLPDTGKPEATTTAATTQTTEPSVAGIPCEGLSINGDMEFDIPGDSYMLSVIKEPSDTTDILEFTSDNPRVAIVDEKGVITAVGSGRAVITVTCGAYSVECVVNCHKEADPDATDPTEETTEATEETTEPTEETTVPVDFHLNRQDITFSYKGESWDVYSGNVPDDEITWSTDDEKVVTVKNGVLTAQGKGKTTIYAEYNGQKLSCTIRCNFEETGEVGGSGGGVGEDGGGVNTGDYSIRSAYGSAADITIDSAITLYLRDANGVAVAAQWTSSNENICTVSYTDNSCVITPVASGQTTVKAVYNGQTYVAIIRVNM